MPCCRAVESVVSGNDRKEARYFRKHEACTTVCALLAIHQVILN